MKRSANDRGAIAIIIEYLRTRPIGLKFFDLLLIMVVVVILSSGYIIATNFPTFFPGNHQHEYVDFIQVLRSNERVHQIMNVMLRETGASRIGIYQFHNGLLGIGRIPFFYYSQTYEVVGPGISSEMSNSQRVPLSIEPDLSSLADDKCLFVDDITQETPIGYIMHSRGVTAYAKCPIFNLENKLIGFVGVEYTYRDSLPDKDELLTQLKRYQFNLSGALVNSLDK